jgi:C-terminal processing protease CtpA/Prc
MRTRLQIVALLAALLPACATATLPVIPEPLPEALPWSTSAPAGAYLGLNVEENDSGSLDNLYFQPGVRVFGVLPGSPAAAAGVQPGDVLLTMDGHEVNDPAALDALLAESAGGQSARLQVQRADTVSEVLVGLAAAQGVRQPPRELWRRDITRSLAGWSTGAGGAVLVTAAEGSPVTAAGLPLGATVLAVDGRETLSDRALIRALQARAPGSRVTLTWRAPGSTVPQQTEIELPREPKVVTGFTIPILFSYEGTADGRKGSVSFIDLWFFELYQHHREDGENRWVFLELFGFELFRFSSGLGELAR